MKNIFKKNGTLPYHVFTKSLKVRYPAELPPTLLAQACVYSDCRQIFHVFSFSFSFYTSSNFSKMDICSV